MRFCKSFQGDQSALPRSMSSDGPPSRGSRREKSEPVIEKQRETMFNTKRVNQ